MGDKRSPLELPSDYPFVHPPTCNIILISSICPSCSSEGHFRHTGNTGRLQLIRKRASIPGLPGSFLCLCDTQEYGYGYGNWFDIPGASFRISSLAIEMCIGEVGGSTLDTTSKHRSTHSSHQSLFVKRGILAGHDNWRGMSATSRTRNGRN